MHAVGAGSDLGIKSFACRGQRIGVGHLENAGDPAHHGAKRTGLEVFLVGEARLAEMHLGVDDAWEDVETTAIHNVGGIVADLAQSSDAALADGDVEETHAVVIDHGGVLENGVVLRHVCGPRPDWFVVRHR